VVRSANTQQSERELCCEQALRGASPATAKGGTRTNDGPEHQQITQWPQLNKFWVRFRTNDIIPFNSVRRHVVAALSFSMFFNFFLFIFCLSAPFFLSVFCFGYFVPSVEAERIDTVGDLGAVQDGEHFPLEPREDLSERRSIIPDAHHPQLDQIANEPRYIFWDVLPLARCPLPADIADGNTGCPTMISYRIRANE
jgi:hypothetical protein